MNAFNEKNNGPRIVIHPDCPVLPHTSTIYVNHILYAINHSEILLLDQMGKGVIIIFMGLDIINSSPPMYVFILQPSRSLDYLRRHERYFKYLFRLGTSDSFHK